MIIQALVKLASGSMLPMKTSHGVISGCWRALCGAKPPRRGGWGPAPNGVVNCPTCVQLAREGNYSWPDPENPGTNPEDSGTIGGPDDE